MKNLLDEKPTATLHGRLLASTHFLDAKDIAGKTILDIGCGFGWCESYLLKHGAHHIAAVEPREEDLVTIRTHIHDPRVGFHIASATHLPFQNRTFDTVVAWDVIEHIPSGQEGACFSEVHRVLKPGGAFYLSTPHTSLLSNALDPAWWLTGHRHYTLSFMDRCARTASLTRERGAIKGGLWMLLSTLNLYSAKWLFHRPPFCAEWFHRRFDKEIESTDGFAHLFLKYRA